MGSIGGGRPWSARRRSAAQPSATLYTPLCARPAGSTHECPMCCGASCRPAASAGKPSHSRSAVPPNYTKSPRKLVTGTPHPSRRNVQTGSAWWTWRRAGATARRQWYRRRRRDMDSKRRGRATMGNAERGGGACGAGRGGGGEGGRAAARAEGGGWGAHCSASKPAGPRQPALIQPRLGTGGVVHGQATVSLHAYIAQEHVPARGRGARKEEAMMGLEARTGQVDATPPLQGKAGGGGGRGRQSRRRAARAAMPGTRILVGAVRTCHLRKKENRFPACFRAQWLPDPQIRKIFGVPHRRARMQDGLTIDTGHVAKCSLTRKV